MSDLLITNVQMGFHLTHMQLQYTFYWLAASVHVQPKLQIFLNTHLQK